MKLQNASTVHQLPQPQRKGKLGGSKSVKASNRLITFLFPFFSLKDYLPKEFLKVKNVEKKIFQQHATLNGLSDIEARVKYCHFCRSLKTYGITFFLVKVSHVCLRSEGDVHRSVHW